MARSSLITCGGSKYYQLYTFTKKAEGDLTHTEEKARRWEAEIAVAWGEASEFQQPPSS